MCFSKMMGRGLAGSRENTTTFGRANSLTLFAPKLMTSLPMSQGDLALLLPLAWEQYSIKQDAFGRYKPRVYTTTLPEEALARLAAANALPDDQARNAVAERLRGELVVQANEFLDAWNLLDGYSEEAWPGKVDRKAMRDAAGHAHYEAAAEENWTEMERLIKSALGFVTANAAELIEKGDMPEDFGATLAGEGEDVRRLTNKFTAAKATAQQGTGAQETAFLASLGEFQKMSGDAQRIFRRQPEVAQLFQTEYLLGLVRGTGQAGIKGALTLADGNPAVGVPVAVPGKAETVSDDEGRFALAVAAGDYTVVLGGRGGWLRQEVPVTVEAGVKKRVDAVVEREESL